MKEKSLKIENNLDKEDNVQIDITSNAENSFSYGLFSDKIPMAVFDYTKLFNIDNNSEYYLSLWSLIFGTGIGGGYKKYYDVNDQILFISSGVYFHMLGTIEDGIAVTGVHSSLGKRVRFRNSKDTFINFGFTLSYSTQYGMSGGSENLFFVLPFLNYEQRF